MTTVLVTGASGFIGNHLVPRLRDAAFRVHTVGRESGDVALESTWNAFPRADVVVHLAGKSFVPESWTHPELFFKCNVMGAVAALQYCRRHNARLVFLSSYLYGVPQRLPISEDAPLSATNPYALSKCMAEEAMRFYGLNFSIPVTVLRPFNVYGPGQDEKFLIPMILRQVREGSAVSVKDLEPRRDYLHVFDLVQAILKAVGQSSGYHVFNIGSGVSHSVAEVIEAIQHAWQTRLPVVSANERRTGEIMDTIADVAAAKLHLDWEPEITLAAGLKHLRAQELAVPS